MLDLDTRRAILHLHRLGHGIRAIARTVGHSRKAVREVLRSGVEEVPRLERAEPGAEHLDCVRELFDACEGNRQRVWEELGNKGVQMPYSTLTGLMRRHGIGVKEKERAGSYSFEPGEEMQHDTSPHEIVIGGHKGLVQCAALVLCFSRRGFTQVYPRWNRFYCKVFLSDALVYFGGAALSCMIDNSSVVIARGSGPNAVCAPEMAAFAERFGFRFVAHQVGDANRSAHVERFFHHVEHNFYPGRRFESRTQLNTLLVDWCRANDQRARRHLGGARPIDLFVTEQRHLKPLPLYVPEVYQIHHRTVDEQGYVHLHTNRYSAPTELIDRQVQVHESKDRVRIFSGHREICIHERSDPGRQRKHTLPEHEHRGRERKRRERREREVLELAQAGKELTELVEALEKRYGRRAWQSIRRLHRLYLDYPNQALVRAAAEALRYGLLDMARIEKMVLRNIADDFFPKLARRIRDDDPEGNDG